jgi:hypothetical protein
MTLPIPPVGVVGTAAGLLFDELPVTVGTVFTGTGSARTAVPVVILKIMTNTKDVIFLDIWWSGWRR